MNAIGLNKHLSDKKAFCPDIIINDFERNKDDLGIIQWYRKIAKQYQPI